MSSAGKSFIVTALCKIFADLGYRVCPFKSQNMALNSGVTRDGLEMGRAQIVQAEAAGIMPDVRMNPILLKPNSDTGSQVIVMGKPVADMSAKDYYSYKTSLVPVIKEAFESLEKEYDVIIVEGAGSPAEINLKENDIVNMGLAKMLDIPVILVGDIDLGGVFAQLLGTIEWLSFEERDYVKGVLINKFRGDVRLLTSGIEMLENRINKKVLGVVPMCDVVIDAEDSVTKAFYESSRNSLKKGIKHSDIKCSNITENNNSEDKDILNIKVIKLPHISNFTDFDPLERLEYVNLSYISKQDELSENDDLIILPGTKSTVSDLEWLIDSGLSKRIKELSENVPIMGICGGYQMFGNNITDSFNIEGGGSLSGLGLLDINTDFCKEKTLNASSGKIDNVKGFFSFLNGAIYKGYEIHAGISKCGNESLILSSNKNVFGTYIHGIFDKADVIRALSKGLFMRKGIDFEENSYDIQDYSDIKKREYTKLASAVKNSIDLDTIFEIMGITDKK